MSNFLADKEIVRWEGHFIERKNEYFWAGLAEYRPAAISHTEPFKKTEKKSRRKLQGNAYRD
jgi:hypothetical protein